MNKSTPDNFQPEQKPNSELQPIVSTSSHAIGNTNVGRSYKYYNTGKNHLGVIGVLVENIKHKDGDYTRILGAGSFQWIITTDLHDTREQAEKSRVAVVL